MEVENFQLTLALSCNILLGVKVVSLADLEKRAAAREQKLRADFSALGEAGKVDELVALAARLLGEALRTNDRLIWERAMSRFPKTSEKVDAEQLALLIEATKETLDENALPPTSDEDDATDKLVDDVAEELERAKEDEKSAAGDENKNKKRRGRRKLPDNLPREPLPPFTIPEQERACPCCGGKRVCIGFDTSEVLELVPAHFKVVEQRREKLVCPKCNDHVETAANHKLVDRLLAGPQLLAHLVVSKFEDHLPLYRLQRFYARLGVPIARSTLAGWSAVAADALEPIVKEMNRDLMEAFLLHADATGIRVLDRDAPDGRRVGTMWSHVGEDADRQIVVFKYAPTASGEDGPWKYLAGRKGYMQADAAPLFDRCYNGRVANAIEVGCWAHARRGFVELLDSDPRAAIPVKLIAGLYQVERLATIRGLAHEQRLELRIAKSKPILTRLIRWIEGLRGREPPASAMAKALGYVLNQRVALSRFLEDGRLPLDNNLCEQQIRPIAVGRSNYLFLGSDQGGERAATHYSILRTCALNGVDPVEYLIDVFRKLAVAWPQRRIAELTPYGWRKAKQATDEAEAKTRTGHST